MQFEIKSLLCSGAVALLGVGCGAAVAPHEIADARRELIIAHQGEAGRRTPSELLIAGHTLDAAERAQAAHPDTTEGRDLAYVSQRQTQLAEAHARRIGIAEGSQQQQANYQRDLEASSRDARAEHASDQATIAANGQQAQAQDQTIQRQQGQLQDSEAARAASDARANDAMRRLSALAAVQETPTRTTITILGSLLFRSGGSELLAGATDRLSAVADALNAQPTRNVTVSGFTDSRGSSSTNQVLSQARADSVRSFLVTRGVDGTRVQAVGNGPSSPVADNATSEGRANNRRVEIVLGPTTSPQVTVR